MMKTVCKGLAINRNTRRAYVGRQIVNLTEREFRLLDILCKNPGHVVLSEVIGATIWGSDYDGESARNSLKRLVSRLRARIGPLWVESIRGRGYRLGLTEIVVKDFTRALNQLKPDSGPLATLMEKYI